MNQIKPKILLVYLYGRGGSGKDSQARRMYQDHPDWVGISTGDRIRDAIKNPEDKRHNELVGYLQDVGRGNFLPDNTVIDLDEPRNGIYSEFVEEQLEAGSPVIVSTGFPRTVSQSVLLDEYVNKLRETYDITDKHIYLDVADETTRQRAAKRLREDIAAGRAPRDDDKPDVVENRLKIFYELTYPVVERLENDGRLIRINAEGSIDEVHREINAELFPPALEIWDPYELHIGRGRRL